MRKMLPPIALQDGTGKTVRNTGSPEQMKWKKKVWTLESNIGSVTETFLKISGKNAGTGEFPHPEKRHSRCAAELNCEQGHKIIPA